MSDYIVLDDGRVWWVSNIAIANVLNQIGISLEKENPKLARWLKDKSDRTSPFMGFDIRGLKDEDINSFYRGAQITYERLYSEHGEEFQNSVLGHAFTKLLNMRSKIVSGEAPEEMTDSDVVVENKDGEIDLNELWNT